MRVILIGFIAMGAWAASAAQAADPQQNDAELCLSTKAAVDKILPCSRAIEKNTVPAKIPLLIARGKAYSELSQDEAAEKDFNEALKLEPDNPEALYDRGAFYTHLQRYSQAIADLNSLIASHPDDPDAHYARAYAFAQIGKDKEAITDLSDVIKAHPEDAESLNDRAGLYLRNGRFKEAIADYDATLKLAKDYNEALYNRGRAYQLMGDCKTATKDFSNLLSLRKNNPYAAMRLTLCGDDRALRPALAAMDPETWPVPLLHYYLDELSAEQVMALASNLGKDTPNATAEAGYYIGARLSLKGDKESAKTYFARAKTSNAKQIIEYYDAILMQGK